MRNKLQWHLNSWNNFILHPPFLLKTHHRSPRTTRSCFGTQNHHCEVSHSWLYIPLLCFVVFFVCVFTKPALFRATKSRKVSLINCAQMSKHCSKYFCWIFSHLDTSLADILSEKKSELKHLTSAFLFHVSMSPFLFISSQWILSPPPVNTVPHLQWVMFPSLKWAYQRLLILLLHFLWSSS